MNFAQNRPEIDKCIVSFSHNRYPSREEANQSSISKAQREIAQGKSGVSHLILRACDDSIDQLKFLFLIQGIPIMCYAMANLLNSSLKEVVVVGSGEVEAVLEAYLRVCGDGGKSVQFVREDPDNLSILKTLALGKGCLRLDPDEVVLFQPGDLPFLYDLEKVLRDKDLVKYNLILWLNSREAMFPEYQANPASEFVKRNYHYRGLYKNGTELHDLKEPNIYPINLTRVELDIVEYLHQARKDGNILRAGIKKALTFPLRSLKLASHLMYHLRHFGNDLRKIRPDDDYKFGAHDANFHSGTSALLNTPFTTKLHNDPSFVSDVDALEDWEDFEDLVHYAKEKDGGDAGLSRIHPQGDLLTRFRDEAMPELKEKLPIYADFPSYVNGIYKDLQMGYVPFDASGCYTRRPGGEREIANAYNWYRAKCEAVKS